MPSRARGRLRSRRCPRRSDGDAAALARLLALGEEGTSHAGPTEGDMSDGAATLYRNGRILTMEDGDPVHEALATRNGRVVAAGALADVRAAAGAGAEEVDLRGTSLMPGIVDTHPHVIHFGVIEGACVDIKDAVSHDD